MLFPSNIGCASSLSTPYTAQDVEAEVAKWTPRLPAAKLMNGGIIKLEGSNGFFNPNSLLDPSWLKGKFTPQEYWQAIDYINKCTAYTQVGLSKIYPISERSMREQMKLQAGVTAVQQLNQKFSSVRFTYQQPAENMQINNSLNPAPLLRYSRHRRPQVVNAAKTVLYIAVD